MWDGSHLGPVVVSDTSTFPHPWPAMFSFPASRPISWHIISRPIVYISSMTEFRTIYYLTNSLWLIIQNGIIILYVPRWFISYNSHEINTPKCPIFSNTMWLGFTNFVLNSKLHVLTWGNNLQLLLTSWLTVNTGGLFTLSTIDFKQSSNGILDVIYIIDPVRWGIKGLNQNFV